ncbi:MAG: D-tyrosyl-tRNA(Tyr) deacylase [Nitrospina sp.]|nr:D-tyrosyl-tRNA(Tyr) deacylase [Nitrospina sp.]MBT6662434.1 D-tyrosyl-tRNA(Tyr) deacylase [Nitrospina sp.]
MKLVLQRVTSASVSINKEKFSDINRGILVFFCAEKGDDESQACFLADKTLNLRIFSDDRGKMNFSCVDVGGDILVVSQFTLAGDCSRGRRPGFDRAADSDTAQKLYQYYVELLIKSGLKVGMGKFAADMKVELINDGPVTFFLER